MASNAEATLAQAAERRMSATDESLREYLEVLIADRLEQRIMDRENKRFRMFYVVFAVVTAIGLGVFLNQIGISADAAVEKRLGDVLSDTEDFRSFTKLLSLGVKLDVKDSFSNDDRDEATRLLISLYKKDKIKADASYLGIAENIIDALAASANTPQILQICQNTGSLCTDRSGIAVTVMQSLGVRVLGATDKHGVTKAERDWFDASVSALRDHRGWGGNAWAYILLAGFRDGDADGAMREQLGVLQQAEPSVRKAFGETLAVLSDRERMSRNPSPDVIAVETLTKRFQGRYGDLLAKMGEAEQPG